MSLYYKQFEVFNLLSYLPEDHDCGNLSTLATRTQAALVPISQPLDRIDRQEVTGPKILILAEGATSRLSYFSVLCFHIPKMYLRVYHILCLPRQARGGPEHILYVYTVYNPILKKTIALKHHQHNS